MRLLAIRFCNVAEDAGAFADLFERTLGLETERLGDPAEGFSGALVHAGDSWIEIWAASEGMPAGRMLQLVVDDADAVAAHARQAGADVKGPMDAHGERIYFIEAPGGLPMSFQSKLRDGP